MRPTARMPYSEPKAMPCTSSGIEYGKKMRTSSRKPTDASASRPACAPRPGFAHRSRARCSRSRLHGPGGGSEPPDAGVGAGGGVSSVVLIGAARSLASARSRTTCSRESGTARRRRELADVVARPDLHVRARLPVVRRRLVLVEVDEAGVLHPGPVARRNLEERLAGVPAADGREPDRRGL